jgi:hypothetical protein
MPDCAAEIGAEPAFGLAFFGATFLGDIRGARFSFRRQWSFSFMLMAQAGIDGPIARSFRHVPVCSHLFSIRITG